MDGTGFICEFVVVGQWFSNYGIVVSQPESTGLCNFKGQEWGEGSK